MAENADLAPTAETLRRAAALMRERAEAATPGPWICAFESVTTEVDGCTCGTQGGPWGHEPGCGLDQPHVEASAPDAEHIASWHPPVALAVADWLDAAYSDWYRLEYSLGAISVRAMSGGSNDPDPNALAVACAYLSTPGQEVAE